MGPKKTMVCMCENCGNEAEMTIKCEEAVLGESAKGPPQPPRLKRTIGLHPVRERSRNAGGV
jgi:hypothetical protein